MNYTDKVIEHFKDPHNQGDMPDADAIGQEGNPVCGDVMKMYIKVNSKQTADNRQEDIIGDIKFETLGCAAAIAVSSILTDMAKGKTLEEANKLTKDDIVRELGGLPDAKIHCSMLGVDALKQAISKYQETHK
jgi:nitrogen fixation NifU-like protein